VRPAKEEQDFQMLNQLPEHALRREFISGINMLRDKIMKEAVPKMYEGKALEGSAIVSMIVSYVEAINSDQFPTIKTAWEHISDDEGAFAYNKALEKYNEVYQKNFEDDEPKGEELHKILINLRDETLTEFNRNLTQPNESYH
jgi:type I site-specific restriction-modification system R (restriction) subunit